MSMSPRPPVDPVEDRADAPGASAPTSRRRFVRNVGLGAAAVGAVAVTSGTLGSVASAQTASETVLPDLGPSDVALAQWMQSLSLAAAAGLTTAAAGTFVSSPDQEMLRAYARTHTVQAAAFGAIIPKDDAVTTPNPKLMSQLDAAVAGATNDSALLSAVQDVESNLAATMLAALNTSKSFVIAGILASAFAVIGQQVAAIGVTTDQAIDEWLPTFATTDGAFTQAAYPVG